MARMNKSSISQMAALNLSRLINVTHRLSIYPLKTSIGSITVSAKLHSNGLNCNGNALTTWYKLKIFK